LEGTSPSRRPGLDAPHPSEVDIAGQALISFIAQNVGFVFENFLWSMVFMHSFRSRHSRRAPR
jgi:hypothetical protein